MKIGVFGGTFDPIHLGHLIVAEEARVLLELDEVLFIPAGRPWLKAARNVSDPHYRMAMVELAVASNPYFRALDMEVTRSGATYTVDTLEELHAKLSDDAELYVILGLDSLREIGRWHKPERLFDLAVLVGVSRPGNGDFDVNDLGSLHPDASSKVRVLHGPQIDISGTDIRQRVAEGKSIKYHVPVAVEDFIYKHGLYKSAG